MEGNDASTYGINVQHAKFSKDKKNYMVCNLHGHWTPNFKGDNPARLEQSENIKKLLDNFEGAKILCGDFNVAPEERDVHDPRLWQGRILFSEPERQALEEVKHWGFTDAFRLHVEGAGHYSWWDYRAGAFRRNHGLRIDHIWVSQPLAVRNTNTSIDLEPRTWERPSDHAPVVAEFE